MVTNDIDSSRSREDTESWVICTCTEYKYK